MQDTFCSSPWPYCPIDWNLLPADIKRLPNAKPANRWKQASEKHFRIYLKHQLQMLLLLPDFALSVKELSNAGSLFAKAQEVDVSARSQARERFNSVSPSSWPHWKRKFEEIILALIVYSNHNRKLITDAEKTWN